MFEARRRAADVGLAEAELVITREQLAAMHDRLSDVEDAVSEARRDLEESAGAPTAREAQATLERLLVALEHPVTPA